MEGNPVAERREGLLQAGACQAADPLPPAQQRPIAPSANGPATPQGTAPCSVAKATLDTDTSAITASEVATTLSGSRSVQRVSAAPPMTRTAR